MIMMRAAAEAVMNGWRKAGAVGDRQVCNAVQNEKTGETASAWQGH